MLTSEKVLLGRNLLLMHAAGKVFTLARAAGVPLVLLKGGALLVSGLRSWPQRQMTDVDLLLRPEDSEWLRSVLARMGFTAMDGSRQAYINAAGKVPILMDLHTELRYRNDLQEVFAHTRDYHWDGVTFAVMRPEECLLELVAHAFLHHGRLEARQRADILSLINNTSDFNWQLLREQAQQCRIGELVYAALEKSLSTKTLESIPQLHKLCGSGLRRWLAALAAEAPDSDSGLDYILPLVFAPRFALVRLVPPQHELRARYPGSSLPWALTRRLWHLGKQGVLGASNILKSRQPRKGGDN